MAKKVKKWFEAGESTGWSKHDKPDVRRRKVLRSKHGDELSAARSLQALSNVTRDSATKRLAQQDANYFYRLHKQRSK